MFSLSLGGGRGGAKKSKPTKLKVGFSSPVLTFIFLLSLSVIAFLLSVKDDLTSDLILGVANLVVGVVNLIVDVVIVLLVGVVTLVLVFLVVLVGLACLEECSFSNCKGVFPFATYVHNICVK